MRFMLFPLRFCAIKKNRILIINDLSYNFSDNPKAVAEYLNKVYKKLEIIYSVKNIERHMYLFGLGYIAVEFNSLKYFFYAMTANVIVTNSGGTSYIPLRKIQYVINTAHGGGAYKKMGVDMFDNSFAFRRDLLLSSKQISLYLSTCKKYTEVVSKSLLIDKSKFWNIGMPRNDILLNGNEGIRTQVRRKLQLNNDEKLVLFAPTYRKIENSYFNNSVAISYGLDYLRVCEALQRRFGGTWRFAIRLHPCVTNKDEFQYNDVLDLSDYEDMQELLCGVDVMINDFSSSMWDFMLTDKPIFLFAIDLKEYEETTEVYTPVKEWPFPKATNNEELENNILLFNKDDYRKNCKQHYSALGGCETGRATQLVCEKIAIKCDLEIKKIEVKE
jgi:CDP-glycerol glycerophosphotransferase